MYSDDHYNTIVYNIWVYYVYNITWNGLRLQYVLVCNPYYRFSASKHSRYILIS